MGEARTCCIDLAALRKDVTKHLDGISLGFFSQIISAKHLPGALDHVLNDPFTAVVRERDPINLH